MTLAPHVHCGECGISIPITYVAGDGTVTETKIRAGQQGVVVPSPDGAQVGLRNVPICDPCYGRIEEAAKRPKILVPGQLREV